MKPQFHKVPLLANSSYVARHEIKRQQSETSWHYHPEMELVYVIRGNGSRYIGNNISPFSAGEVILLGENIPHIWRFNKEVSSKGHKMDAEALSIHFHPECLGKDIFQLQEAYLLPRLFERAKSGLLIQGAAREKVASLMQEALEATNLDRIIILLKILKTLAESNDLAPICISHNVPPKSSEYDQARLNEICSYTLSNYKNDITLEEISAISHLSTTSFCRYFKSMTKKTYYNFLNEIRVSQACKLLIEDKIPTNIICFESGFNNISNFYRHFKKVTGVTPFEYKKKYLSC